MKKLPIAAAALLFGTSAYAMMPQMDPNGSMAQDPYTITPTTAVTPVYDDALGFKPAAETSWDEAQPVAYTADKTDPAYKAVVATDEDMKAAWSDKTDVTYVPDKMNAEMIAGDGADWDAVAAAKMDAMNMGEAAMRPAAIEAGFTDSPDMSGVGGPYEAADTAAADLAPRPATHNYPACRPGPGDDNCIQLYEPGVQQRLASWSQPAGGFAGAADTQIAMGGPYEPADSATSTEQLNQQALADSTRALQTASVTTDGQAVDDSAIETAMADTTMSGDGSIDTAMGETADDEAVGAA